MAARIAAIVGDKFVSQSFLINVNVGIVADFMEPGPVDAKSTILATEFPHIVIDYMAYGPVKVYVALV